MTRQRYAVVADRADGSTIGAEDLHADEVVTLVRDALGVAAKLTILTERAGVKYALVQSPVLPLDDAIAWRQPDDQLTRIFRGTATDNDVEPKITPTRMRIGLTLDEYNTRFDAIIEHFRSGQLTRSDASAAMRELTSQHIWR